MTADKLLGEHPPNGQILQFAAGYPSSVAMSRQGITWLTETLRQRTLGYESLDAEFDLTVEGELERLTALVVDRLSIKPPT